MINHIISSDLKRFIEDNITLVETHQFEELYAKLSSASYGALSAPEITAVLESIGINPLEHMKHIPPRFKDNFGLTELELPSNIEMIGADAFRNNKIEFLYIPEHVVSIHAKAFASNHPLKLVSLPSSLKHIGMACFFGVDNLKTILYGSTVEDFFKIDFGKYWISPSNATSVGVVKCTNGEADLKLTPVR